MKGVGNGSQVVPCLNRADNDRRPKAKSTLNLVCLLSALLALLAVSNTVSPFFSFRSGPGADIFLSLPLAPSPSSPTMFTWAVLVLSLALTTGILAQTYTATYLPDTAPAQTEQGQAGTNRCGTGANQTSSCQNVYGQHPYFSRRQRT
jgi:hypothetical protein